MNKYYRILFVCHGNICRSPMAEFVMKDMVEKRGFGHMFYIASAATSTEEIGNPVHMGTRQRLAKEGISVDGKYAVQVTKSDYDKYDYIIIMDDYNRHNLTRIIGCDSDGKVHKLMEYTENCTDVPDPWYTGDFEATYRDVVNGCSGLLAHIIGGDI